MQFNNFFTAIVSFACLAGAVSAAAVVPEASASSAVDFSEKSVGCFSHGPLGTGTASPYILAGCSPKAQYQCQVMDSTGCNPGDETNIRSLEILDPNAVVEYASSANLNTLTFVCPSWGGARCQVNLASATDGPSYSLRVVPQY